jgi:hypothetical protein
LYPALYRQYLPHTINIVDSVSGYFHIHSSFCTFDFPFLTGERGGEDSQAA